MKILKDSLRVAAYWLFVLCVPLFLLTASIALAVNNPWLYGYGFEKYDISHKTGLASVELDKAARGLINYFNSNEEYINLTVIKDGRPFKLFNEREVIHLKDVKELFRLDYTVLLGMFMYGLVYSLFMWRRHNLRSVFNGLFTSSVVTLGLIAVLGLTALLDFDQFFLQFHLLSFSNDFWQLDPAHDYLIMLFPQGFWFDATIFIALIAVTGAIVVCGLSRWRLHAYKNTDRLD